MKKDEYLAHVENKIQRIIENSVFNNYRKQLVAKKLWASFNSTYKEEYLWNKLLYISTNSCILISELINEKLTNEALRICWKIYEDLSEISEKYDVEYCLILSALCYDLAWYQANSVCLMRRLQTEYVLEPQDKEIGTEVETKISNDNYILKHIQQILLKNIPIAKEIIFSKDDKDGVINYFNWIIEILYNNILNWADGDFISGLDRLYKYYLKNFNVPMAHIFLLLRTKIEKYLKRSIWMNLNNDPELARNPNRIKYIKLLTYDFYERNKIKNINKRVSIFELWLSQLRAIESWLLELQKNFVIQMPTSAGKTFIAEISILSHLIKFPQKKCIYIAPFKALTNEKEDELSRNLARLWYSVSTLSWSYEIDDYQRLLMDETDVLIATPEKIDLLFRLNNNYFNGVSLIVIDEWHIVWNNDQRGSLLEFLIIRLKIKVPEIRMLFISAVMPPNNANEYSSRLNNGDSSNVIRALLNKDSSPNEQWEPTLKLIWKFIRTWKQWRIDFKDISTEDESTKINHWVFIQWIIEVKRYGRKSFPHPSDKAETVASLALKFSEKWWTFIFCWQPRNVLSICNAYIRLFELEEFSENVWLESYYYAKLWLWESHPITNCIKRWIWAHFGDLPEQLRNSVENDFRRGNLKILISTNTIWQWINLPIKNVIFHSTLIRWGVTIRCNDFMNIIGRAWRAWMETEGKIIFVSNTVQDEKTYAELTNKDNLEPANSLFFNILQWFVEGDITYEDYDNAMNVLSEPYLFDLMIEGNLTESEAIEKIINNSLFKIQVENRALDISILRKSLTDIYGKIKLEVDSKKLKIYSMTWLSLESNKAIHEYIEENKEILHGIISRHDYMSLLTNMFTLFDAWKIQEIVIDKLRWVPLSSYLDLINLWIHWASIEETREKWTNMNLFDDSKLFVLMSHGFEYKFSWLIHSFLIILSDCLDLELNNLPTDIKNLAWYVKFWTNDNNVCLARTIWIKNRESAKELSTLFKSIWGGSSKDFIRFISNLQYEDIKDMGLSQFESDNINNTSLRLRPKDIENKKVNIFFDIKWIFHEAKRRENSREVQPWDELTLIRDSDNEHDPFAILLFNDGKELWFIPKELSKKIWTDIDLGNVAYKAKVLKTTKLRQYSNVYCELIKL